jgi:bifunctional UDP-N-acetylglucosamine pyrophosphorylase/glucosamine-1-phosphate N-acetyltransferase
VGVKQKTARGERPRRREKAPAPEAAPRVVVLAAGVGSRMRSSLPKVLHRIGGRPMLHAVLDTAERLSPAVTVVVLGAARPRVEEALSDRSVKVALQDPPLGTGDAVRCALEALEAASRSRGGDGPVLVLSGDVPLLRPETLSALIARRRDDGLDLAFLSFRPPEPGAFGRVVRDPRGRVRRIVEARNASAKETKIGEVNAGVYCFERDALARSIQALEKNPLSGEYYLTDTVEWLARGGRVDAIELEDWREAWGINTRRDLAAAEEIERRRSVDRALDSGATILDPSSVRIGPRVRVGRDVVLHPFVCLEGETEIGDDCEVFSFTRIAGSRLEPGSSAGPHSDVEGAVLGARSHAGPYSRVRPGTVLAEDVRLGNFVEAKNAVIGKGTKALHLAYLGDAEIGAGVNIGAGVITCNYDGVNKHRTTIGAGAFIGSDSQLVAPVTIGPDAYVGAGSTITKDVASGALAITRAPLKTVDGWATRRKSRKGG